MFQVYYWISAFDMAANGAESANRKVVPLFHSCVLANILENLFTKRNNISFNWAGS